MLQAGEAGETGWATDTAFSSAACPFRDRAFTWLAVRSGIAIRPPDLEWRLLMGGGLLAGIGFTMTLFIANLAFSQNLIDCANLGIFLASAFSAVAGLALLRWSPARGEGPRHDRCPHGGSKLSTAERNHFR